MSDFVDTATLMEIKKNLY